VLGNVGQEAQHTLQLIGVVHRWDPAVLIVGCPAEGGECALGLLGQRRRKSLDDPGLGQWS
jgi:hypothetical protein